MGLEQNSKCWYEKVCTAEFKQSENCTGCIRYVEMKNLLNNSGIPVKRQYPEELTAGCDFDAFCILADIKDNILEFVNEGNNIYICSAETGNGKTSWAIKLMLKYFDCIWAGNGLSTRGLFVHVPTLLTQLKDFNNPLPEEYKKALYAADLIIWDDVASTKLSAYDDSQLLTIIDQRILEQKSNIYTSNQATKENLENSVGMRLASRIWNKSIIVEFKGKDRR